MQELVAVFCLCWKRQTAELSGVEMVKNGVRLQSSQKVFLTFNG